MTRAKVYRYRVTFGVRDIPAVLDMLRYDWGQVETWSRENGDRYTAHLVGTRYTPDRWASFGLHPTLIEEDYR